MNTKITIELENAPKFIAELYRQGLAFEARQISASELLIIISGF